MAEELLTVYHLKVWMENTKSCCKISHAQLVEHWTSKLKVMGSFPTAVRQLFRLPQQKRIIAFLKRHF